MLTDFSMNSNKELHLLISLLNYFLNKFDWTPSFSANDLLVQENRGDERLTGICYDACKYLAQKLKESGIQFRSWWIGQTGESFIEKWRKCEGLHSFNICQIPVTGNKKTETWYYFADNAIAPYCLFRGFRSEREAIEIAVKLIAGDKPYILREFNPLTVKRGCNISYTVARILGLNG